MSAVGQLWPSDDEDDDDGDDDDGDDGDDDDWQWQITDGPHTAARLPRQGTCGVLARPQGLKAHSQKQKQPRRPQKPNRTIKQVKGENKSGSFRN